MAEIKVRILDDRNRMVHDYSKDYSEKLFNRIKESYAPAFQELLKHLTE